MEDSIAVLLLDDIVSELWRKENVTSGYCPHYRYTLIATLTLANLYYICVDFLPTHTIGGSVLPAHFLRAFVGLSGVFHSCRSFHVDRSFGRPRSCGNYLLCFRWVILFRGSHYLVPCFMRDLFVGLFFVVSLDYFRWLFVSREFSCGLFVRDSK
jgi:hypothetical protein